MRTGTGIFLITAGAVLQFALAGDSPHGLNVHIVGVILILAGALGLLLPQVARAAPRDRLRRWVRPDQPRAYDEPPTANQAPTSTARPWCRTTACRAGRSRSRRPPAGRPVSWVFPASRAVAFSLRGPAESMRAPLCLAVHGHIADCQRS